MNKLALIVISALSLSSAAALADTVTVNGGTVHFKGKWLTRPARLMLVLSTRPFS
jgi:type 1 fimbria pilin